MANLNRIKLVLVEKNKTGMLGSKVFPILFC